MELVVATVISLIVILCVGIVLAGSHNDWNKMYSRVYDDIVTGSYNARSAFDSTIRMASRGKLILDEDDGSWLEVYYYNDSSSTSVDRYARFYESDGDLNIDYGTLNPKATLSTSTVCSNVSDCVFKATGRSAQMILTLDDGTRTACVVSSAVLNNE